MTSKKININETIREMGNKKYFTYYFINPNTKRKGVMLGTYFNTLKCFGCKLGVFLSILCFEYCLILNIGRIENNYTKKKL